jgi:hypothetical protein
MKTAKPQGRIYLYRLGLFYDYKRRDEHFKNEYFNNQDWYIQSEDFVFIRLSPRLFELENLYYDGHTVKSITVLGVTLGMGYTYDSRPLHKWTPDEMARIELPKAAKPQSGNPTV